MTFEEFHQRKTQRLKGYDYSTPGCYFITVCIDQFFEYFGDIKNNKIKLNEYGRIAYDAWLNVPDHFPDVVLDDFIVMPHHIHGIVKIRDIVGTGHALSATLKKNSDLSTIVGSFKSAASREINDLNKIYFKWQRSFYDHIIRNGLELRIISKYIKNNPGNWEIDKKNVNNLLI